MVPSPFVLPLRELLIGYTYMYPLPKLIRMAHKFLLHWMGAVGLSNGDTWLVDLDPLGSLTDVCGTDYRVVLCVR